MSTRRMLTVDDFSPAASWSQRLVVLPSVPQRLVTASTQHLFLLQPPSELPDTSAWPEKLNYTSSVLLRTPLCCEIQHLTTAHHLVYAVDSSARVCVYRSEPLADVKKLPNEHFTLAYCTAELPCATRFGWAGVSVSATKPTQIATASFWDQRLCVYDEEHLTQTIGCAHKPTSVHFSVIDEHSLFYTEGGSISRIDLRVPKAKTQTLDVCGPQPLYASAELDTEILVGGANRS
eukprot:CAMPEP_0174241768 /NCGR_PEP_ID=MMETSP0417-20130205/24758_1 /TAXON_ID=242541 /ORGANISM="Mayorella sp, Strain BSH-02190019" /LENGTH=233 /DNA_ID=CAMNT_0015321059 /DNA_START=91 /DNA_END=789 /DNA_ORIENTATION=-